MPPGSGHFHLQDAFDGSPVGQTGEGIEVGQSIEPFGSFGPDRERERSFDRDGREIRERLRHTPDTARWRDGFETQRQDSQRELDAIAANDHRQQHRRFCAAKNGHVVGVFDFERDTRSGGVGQWIVAGCDAFDLGRFPRDLGRDARRNGERQLVAIDVEDVDGA